MHRRSVFLDKKLMGILERPSTLHDFPRRDPHEMPSLGSVLAKVSCSQWGELVSRWWVSI